MNKPQAGHESEKRAAALSSVLAAVGLTVTKVVVGLVTGSLGILAEAAHSGLDLVAAIMTYLAVKFASEPPDPTHLYGHGKVENLSALFETLLLLLTCGWIIYEAIHRLFFKAVEVEVTFWSFAVMTLSIVVDVSRSRMLYRVAKKYNSQALEADALHFSTDIWSSGVVLLGLAGVKLSEWVHELGFMRQADAIAALVVAMIVVYVSFQLGHRTVQALMDAAPRGLEVKIKRAVEAIPGVRDCHNIRLRCSGARLFVDVHILVDGGQTLSSAHSLADLVEENIQQLAPDADVTVHPEPCLEPGGPAPPLTQR